MRRPIEILLALLMGFGTCLSQTTMTVRLPPPDHRGEPDALIMTRFDLLWEKCTAGVLSHRNDTTTATSCKAAADLSNELSPSTRLTERRTANVYAATAFANIGDLKSALPFANRAVEIVRAGKVTGSGAEAAFETRAQIRAFSGDLEGAEPDATVADGYAREMAKLGLSSSQLKKDLLFHADLLKRLGRASAAEPLLSEAGTLTP